MLKIDFKTKFDKEYQTQWFDEVNYLEKNGIKYTFVKTVNGLSTFKFTKTKRLFELLSDFYADK